MAGSRADREARLKAALRDNLRKRKPQERGERPDLPSVPEAEGSTPAEG
ncbi:MAG: hypothetical protein ACK5SX_03495 [Sandaracinobacter sp.]